MVDPSKDDHDVVFLVLVVELAVALAVALAAVQIEELVVLVVVELVHLDMVEYIVGLEELLDMVKLAAEEESVVEEE